MLSARNPNVTPNSAKNSNRSFRCVIERCHALCSTQESLVNHFLAQHIPVRRIQLSEVVYCGWEGCEQLTNLTHFTVSGLVRHYQQHLQAEYSTLPEAVQKVGEPEEEGDGTRAVAMPEPVGTPTPVLRAKLKHPMQWDTAPVIVRPTPNVQVVAILPTPTSTTPPRVVASTKMPPSPPLRRVSPPRIARPLSPDQIKCRFDACTWHQCRNVEGGKAPVTRLLNHVFMHHAGGEKDPYEDGPRPCLWSECAMVRWMPEMEAVRYHLTKHAMEDLGEFSEVNSA